jgi:hypothetical protein
VWSFRVFGRTGRNADVTAASRALVRFAVRSEYAASRRIALSASAIPPCRWPLPRLRGLPATRGNRLLESVRILPPVELGPSLKLHSIQPSRSPQRRRPLSWTLAPYSTCRTRRSPGDGTPADAAPPTGFGYPPDGLIPPSPRRPCFMPTALMGFAAKLRPREARRPSPTDEAHLPFVHRASTAARAGRSRRPRLLGCAPRKAPGPADRFLAHRRPEAPRVPPSRHSNERLGTAHPPAPPTYFATATGTTAGTPEYQPALAEPRPTLRQAAQGRDNPLGVLAPIRSASFETGCRPGYVFTGFRVARHRRPPGCLRAATRLCRS